MLAVLQHKFSHASAMADRLLVTGQAFLLEHNSREGRDRVWSDNCNGQGTNWLGLQLMLIRDRLRQSLPLWTSAIGDHVDLSTGTPHDAAWQSTVISACHKLQATFCQIPEHASENWCHAPAGSVLQCPRPVALEGKSRGFDDIIVAWYHKVSRKAQKVASSACCSRRNKLSPCEQCSTTNVWHGCQQCVVEFKQARVCSRPHLQPPSWLCCNN